MFSLRPWKIGKIMGIPIGIDPSWFVIFVVVTYPLAREIFPVELGMRRGLTLESIVLSIVASLLLFASVLAHELSHAWMAIRRGIPVIRITLFIFGGVAQIGDEPDRPATEFLIAIMGPLMSFLLAVLFAIFWIWPMALMGLFANTRTVLLPVAVLGGYLAQANLLLALFNLLPGFPLDGGRVFRAILWAVLRNLRRATLIAMLTGRGIAAAMIAFAIWQAFFAFGRGDLSALWLALVGWFLWQAAGEAYRQVVLRDTLEGITVRHLMHTPIQHVAAQLSLMDFVEQFMMRQRVPLFAVQENSRAVGLIGAEQIRNVPHTRWASTRVREAMLELAQTNFLKPQDSALRALQVLQRDGTRSGADELPVVEDGDVVGTIGREQIARYLQLRGQ